MRRLFFFTLKLALLTGLAVWVVARDGPARMVWNGYIIETSASFLGFSAVAIGFVFYLLFRLWNLLRNGPERWRLHRKLKKWRQGQDHLAEGLVAVAGGDAAEAGRQAVYARRLLGPTTTTQLLQAQAAQLAGDHRAAQEIFRALAGEPASAVLGYRGLIMEARRAGNWEEMERLIEKLNRLKPETPWLNLVRFELLARQQNWGEANLALSQVASAQLLEPAKAKAQRAALLVAASQDDARQGRTDKALQAAEQAVKQMPGWLPAVINLAQQQATSGHRRAAQRTIEKNWERAPHPQLAAIWREGAQDPIEVCKQIEKLCRGSEEAPASRLAMAEAALAADIWGEARRHLIALISHGGATQSAYRLLARLERRESADEQAALQWLTRAVDAPADPAWLCCSCGGSHATWQALCAHCGQFNTLEWRSPGVSRVQGTALQELEFSDATSVL